MKKLLTMILLAGMILMTAVITSAQESMLASGILSGVEEASPVNWRSDKPVWKSGKIDIVDGKSLVIDDTRYLLSGGIHFFNSDGMIINMSSFNDGTEVTFVLDSDRKTITKLIKD